MLWIGQSQRQKRLSAPGRNSPQWPARRRGRVSDPVPFTLAIDESAPGDEDAFFDALARLILSIPEDEDDTEEGKEGGTPGKDT